MTLTTIPQSNMSTTEIAKYLMRCPADPVTQLETTRIHQVLRKMYAEYVDDFDPTPEYLYDMPYSLMSYEDFIEEKIHGPS